jgi:Outer membrane protein beta-barrel domain
MTGTLSAAVVCAGLVATAAKPVAAQDLRPGAFGAIAVANLYRAEDRSFGTELNLGAGVGFEWKHLGMDGEVHRTIGLTPRPIQCASVNVNVTCVGSAREGFLNATMLSGNVSYFFGRHTVRPYVIGSIGVLRTESVNSLTIASSTAATMSEFHESDAGLAIGAGFGVDVPLTRAVSLRPELRTYSSSLMSRVNLGVHRATLGVRYAW